MIFECFSFKLASSNINRELTQEYFDLANYTVEAKVGDEVVKEVKEILENYFIKKQEAAHVNIFLIEGLYCKQFKSNSFSMQNIAKKVVYLYQNHINSGKVNTDKLKDLSKNVYKDADIPKLLPENMIFSS